MAQVHKKAPLDTRIRLARLNVRQLAGDFSPAQWRDDRVLQRAQAPIPQRPLWNGGAMPGETLLIWDIDTSPRRATGPRGFGVGDIVQLARMLAPVKCHSQAAQVIFQVPKGLGRFLTSLQGPDVIVDRVPATGFDRPLRLVCMPMCVPLTPEIFGAVPYLAPEPEVLDRWRPTFHDRGVVHIGVHWQAEAIDLKKKIFHSTRKLLMRSEDTLT